MSEISKAEFLREYSKSIKQGAAATFIGAGFSVGAGFVDWRSLLEEIAEDLGLNINEESDLIALAQYEYNRKKTRDRLNKKIIEEFSGLGKMSEAHRWLARLAISTVWTTNYDKLLETAYGDANKQIDVKFRVAHLAHHQPYSDVTIYKMHGDVSDPDDAVLTKDDYERYDIDKRLFTEKLRSDLSSKQFLFLGFSFTDPNIEYALSRLRALLKEKTKEHYCIMRRPQPKSGKKADKEKHKHELARFKHRIDDLARFGIQTVVIENFNEITELLAGLHRLTSTGNVFVSGSAQDYSPMGRDKLESLARRLGRELIENGFNLVSGFGLSIGGACIIGAHEALRTKKQGHTAQRLRLHPFPQNVKNETEKKQLYTQIRNEMILESGVSIFLCGNKINSKGALEVSSGMMEEFELAKQAGHFLIPVAGTGHAAKKIWEEIRGNLGKIFAGVSVTKEFETLEKETNSEGEIIKAIFSILEKVRKKGAS